MNPHNLTSSFFPAADESKVQSGVTPSVCLQGDVSGDKSLMKNDNPSSCGGADALTSVLVPYRSLRICPVGAPRHYIRRAHNLKDGPINFIRP
jgi:hypothetical protein